MSSSHACTCQEQCPRDDFCGCIFIYEDEEGDEGDCLCDCGIIVHSPRALPVSARVAISTKEIGLARLAAFLDQQCGVDILVPEGREREKVSLHMRDSTLAEVIEAAGLTIRDGGPPNIGSGY